MVCFTLWLLATTAFLGTSSAFEFQLQTCEDYTCDAGRVCVTSSTGPTCAVKNGLPCAFDDYCEGGYYCPGAKVCAGGPDGIPEGSSCPQGVGCKPGLYCDRSQKEYKCLKIQGGSYCTGDSQCNQNCSSSKGCYCDKGKCFPNP